MVVSNLFPPVRHAITGESEGLGYDFPSDELELDEENDEDAEQPEEDESDFDDYGVTNDSQENSREDNWKDLRG